MRISNIAWAVGLFAALLVFHALCFLLGEHGTGWEFFFYVINFPVLFLTQSMGLDWGGLPVAMATNVLYPAALWAMLEAYRPKR